MLCENSAIKIFEYQLMMCVVYVLLDIKHQLQTIRIIVMIRYKLANMWGFNEMRWLFWIPFLFLDEKFLCLSKMSVIVKKTIVSHAFNYFQPCLVACFMLNFISVFV